MVCTYSDKRAKKDRFDRYRALDKANNVILNNQKSSLSSTKSFKKYIQKHTKEDNCKEFDMGMDWEKMRIEAHFIICFIAFMLERDLEIRLKKSKSFREHIITPDRIRDALNSLEVSKIKMENKIFFMKSNHSNGQDKLKFAKDIMRFLHIKQLKNISTKEELLCLV